MQDVQHIQKGNNKKKPFKHQQNQNSYPHKTKQSCPQGAAYSVVVDVAKHNILWKSCAEIFHCV